MSTQLSSVSRRSALRAAAAGLTGAVMTAATTSCAAGGTDTVTSPETKPSLSTRADQNGGRILLAYFSRAGENYHYGDRTNLDVGNTEVLAGMISALIPCDVHRIEAADPYPYSYDATVARNVREQNQDARPAIANPLPVIGQYDTVILASGIWNVRAPMIMTTFAESYDFTGKTIHAVTTHAMSGLGTTARDYRGSCPEALIGEGLAVKGEEVRGAGVAIEAWLKSAKLIAAG